MSNTKVVHVAIAAGMSFLFAAATLVTRCLVALAASAGQGRARK